MVGFDLMSGQISTSGAVLHAYVLRRLTASPAISELFGVNALKPRGIFD